MTETEVFKIVLNNGFMALFVLWVLFRGEPKHREMITAMSQANSAALTALSTDSRNTLEAMRTTFAQTIATVSARMEGIIETMHKECREERNDILTRMLTNEEKDREARHKQAETFQQAVAEIHEMYVSRYNNGPANHGPSNRNQ